MITTRDAILELLQLRGPLTSHEISGILDRTPADIRYHLALLRNRGAVESLPPDDTTKERGRPRPRYRLSRHSYATPIYRLASAMLSLEEALDPEAQQVRLDKIAKPIAPAVPPNQRFSIRLNDLVRGMEALGYRLRWEARRQGPVITVLYSPFQALYEQFPHASSLDARIVQHALGMPVAVLPFSRHHGGQRFQLEIQSYRPLASGAPESSFVQL